MFISYNDAKYTLVMAAYWMLITFELWWCIWLLKQLVKFVVKKIKQLWKKLVKKEETPNE